MARQTSTTSTSNDVGGVDVFRIFREAGELVVRYSALFSWMVCIFEAPAIFWKLLWIVTMTDKRYVGTGTHKRDSTGTHCSECQNCWIFPTVSRSWLCELRQQVHRHHQPLCSINHVATTCGRGKKSEFRTWLELLGASASRNYSPLGCWETLSSLSSDWSVLHFKWCDLCT